MDVFCEPEALSFCRTLSFFRTVKPKHYWTYNQFLKLLRHNLFIPEIIRPYEFYTPLRGWTQKTGILGLEKAGKAIGRAIQDQGIPGIVLSTNAKLREVGFLNGNGRKARLRWDLFEMRCSK